MANFATKAEVKSPANDAAIKPTKKKKSITTVSLVVEICVFVVFFPIFGGLIASYFVLSGLRWISYFFTDKMQKYHIISVKTFKLVFYSIFLAFAICFLILMCYVYDGSMLFLQANILPTYLDIHGILNSYGIFFSILGKGYISSLFLSNVNLMHLVGWYFIDLSLFSTSAFLVAGILFIIFVDPYIFKLKTDDFNKHLNVASTGETYERPKRIWLNRLAFWTGYQIQNKENRNVEKNELEKKNKLTPENGAVVSFAKDNQIFYYKNDWKFHAAFVGGDRSGKTNNMLSWIISGIHNNYPVIFIDVENDTSTLTKINLIAQKLEMQYFSWKTTIDGGQNLKYAPFRNKSPHDRVRMLVEVFTINKTNGQYIQAVHHILNFMAGNNVEVNFTNLFRYTDVNSLKEILARQTVKNNRHKNHVATILNQGSLPNSTLQVLHTDVGEFLKYANELIEESEAKTAINLLDVLNGHVRMFYANFLPNLPYVISAQLQRMIFQDTLITIGQYQNKTRYVLFALHEPHEFFTSVDDVKTAFHLFKKNKIAFGVDIGETNGNKAIAAIDLEIIANSKTYYIHNIVDPIMLGALDKQLSHCRAVKPLFQFVDLGLKYARKAVIDAPSTNPEETKARLDLIAGIQHTPVGQILFKTVYTSKNYYSRTTYKTYDIFYNKYIDAPKFEEYLDYVARVHAAPTVANKLEVKKVSVLE